MKKEIYETYLQILKDELVPALGCTEPIAIAFATAKAASLLGKRPDRIEMLCSGNIIKNVQGVTVPNSGGLKGIEAAAILGAIGGDATKELKVLEFISDEAKEETASLLNTGFCTSLLAKGVENLYISTKMYAGEHSVELEIQHLHTNITKVIVDGKEIINRPCGIDDSEEDADKDLLNVKDILEFANVVDIDEVREILDKQISLNTAISDAGLSGNWGACIGKTIMKMDGDNVIARAKARAAAGSDARMNGCPLPVVIVSGSGNQGVTASMPVIEFAEELKVDEETMYRALIISNLVALHQKKYIGRLSAFCGAVCAACGRGAAITYLYGGDYEAIGRTIVNTIANVGGIVCDGAKSSCAAKIASSVDAAILAHNMSMDGIVFEDGEGLVQDDVEQTIRNIGQVGRIGMHPTDIEILNIMLNMQK
ncbi:MAG: serine dehydratase subunit alpha family protein [Suipraeoptans sp.]